MLTAMLLATICLTQASDPTFDELKKRALITRRAIKTSHVVLTVEESNPSRNQAIRKCEWEIWADQSKIRSDRTCKPQPDDGVRFVAIRNCEKPGWGFAFTEKPWYSATFSPINPQLDTLLSPAIHPHHFGYVIDRVSHSADPGFEGLFSLANPGSIAVSPTVVDGRNCWKLTWSKFADADRLNLSAVIDPSRSDSVIACEYVVQYQGKPFIWRTQSELTKWGETWYPNKIVFEKTHGTEIIFREVATIHQAEFNIPIPSEVFTREGAKLPYPVPISSSDKKEQGVWDQGKLVSLADHNKKHNSPLPPPMLATDPAERQWNPWLLALSIALGLAAVVLIVLKVRAKRAAS